MSSVKKICICAFCIALSCVLPAAFHAVGLGSAFSPIHLPALLCGLVCGWPYGAFCGIAGPALSCVITGMPGPAMLVYMIPEVCVYGLATGLGMKLIHTGKPVLDVYLSLAPAMVAGRVAGGVARALFYLATAQSYSIALWAGAYFVETIPAMVLQLVVLPALVWALTRARLVPARYPRECAAA